MVAEERDEHDGELVEVYHTDPIRAAFGAAIREVVAMLPDGPACEAALREIVEAEHRTRRALVRRILN